jgi:multiple sugar transport system substrate-binding protein
MTTTSIAIDRRTLLLGGAALGAVAAFGSPASMADTGPVRFGIFGNAQKLEIRGKSIAR